MVLCACALTLVGLAIPAILRGRAAARSRQCALRQFRVALAFQRFEQEFSRLPGWRELQAVDAQGNERATSWVFPLLPFLATSNVSSSPTPPAGSPADTQASAPQPPNQPQPSAAASTLLALYDAHGPAGPDATRGLPPELDISDLICPEAALAWSPPSRPIGPLSWRLNSGLPDVLSESLDESLPADWPANGVALDRFADRSERSISRLKNIESLDGMEHTVLLVESADAVAWTEATESDVGAVAGWPFDSRSSASDSARFDRWFWCGLGTADEPRRSVTWRRGSSRHEEGIQVTLCSGATSVFSTDTDPWLWAQLTFSHNAGARYPGTEISIVRPEPASAPTISDNPETPDPTTSAAASAGSTP